MSRRAPSARLFVAVDPPEQVAVELTGWARSAARDMHSHGRAEHQPLRVLDHELLHVTLCFLGDRAVEEIPSLVDQLAACERQPAQLSVGAPLWLPPRRPRALAVELHDPTGALAQMQARLLSTLAMADTRRRFRPHITIARMSAGAAPRQRTLPPTPAISFSPSELVLYRSWLSSDGASYESLGAFPLA